MHRSIRWLMFGAVLLVVFAGASSASAGPVLPLDWKQEVNKRACGELESSQTLVHLREGVTNAIDSGLSGYWAYEEYERLIQVYRRSDGSYCAIVSYEGTFQGVAGQTSPGDEALTLDGTEKGKFEGGRRAIIEGTLLATPLWPTRGKVRTDYQCNIITTDCPGRISWPDQFFESGYTYVDEWWGWRYPRTGTKCKTCVWINAIGPPDGPGNQGDIVQGP